MIRIEVSCEFIIFSIQNVPFLHLLRSSFQNDRSLQISETWTQEYGNDKRGFKKK